MKRCIVCKAKLEELFRIENMPASAQDIPGWEELERDRATDIRLCACRGCGLVQLESEPVHYFRDVIRAGGGSSTMEALRMSQYEEFIRIGDLGGKKILEAGCGAGEFLEILARYPVQAYGMEHKEELVRKAREKGLTVSAGYPESEEEVFEHAPFDAFCSFNFLEHQPNPVTYLKAIANNLKEGGFGLLTVPSFEYILEEKSFYEIIPDHIAYYTFESLAYAVQSAGFEIIGKKRVNRDTLELILKKRALPDIGGILQQKEAIGEQVSALLRLAGKEKKKIAIWGASHQGFTLCATLLSSRGGEKRSKEEGGRGGFSQSEGREGEILYIIDSAKFKQGRYAPASHIPIVSPAQAKADPPDIVIIVAPGYTDEIAGVIRRDFRSDISVYTLMSESLERLW